ncbi:bacteriochlorophyll 4-vinyl reductase [Roseovarius sp. LXJ103]|uniref:bacteriochlorophyll 4-vinyl reductase n=1 Tax=Roseovarius carneus TaxID=2853164 RepID=UPI000D6204D8|nr:bacteriochlorophyll 4-vinyl reductase [Roseovarius carneus]MBZ8119675.1 bacteriochlorophyll 4-vinyl reductase [Roseovarius carneus]PWE34712.1 bacteriochlorophyll 4-vinyl reductase [Pelagicola sp. LXJ1103]
MPDGAALPQSARIGPNALLQLVPVLDEAIGEAGRIRLFEAAGVPDLPSGAEMIDEVDVIAVHQMLRQTRPDDFPTLAAAAGRGTGAYILNNRIPEAAQFVLRALPPKLSSHILVRAISKNAWTFMGSGEFRVIRASPPILEVFDNPMVRGAQSDTPLCHWHAAVFARLFGRLCGMGRVRETQCCAMGAPACRFEITEI